MVKYRQNTAFTNGVLANWQQLTGFPLLLGISLFSIQLYLDWMGCMDIAHGVSEIFGINLDRNFWHPFFSKNMPEFWRRWHISLGAWFKDYLLYRFQCQVSKKINKSQEENGETRLQDAFQQLYRQQLYGLLQVFGMVPQVALCFGAYTMEF